MAVAEVHAAGAAFLVNTVRLGATLQGDETVLERCARRDGLVHGLTGDSEVQQ